MKESGCYPNCGLGISDQDLDEITDNVNNTLEDPRGRKMFDNYFVSQNQTDNIKSLKLYKMCSKILERGQVLSPRELTNRVREVRDAAEDAPGIDLDLMRKFNQALRTESRNALIDVVTITKDRCSAHLRTVHEYFKEYVMANRRQS